jgi:hypothetical protein
MKIFFYHGFARIGTDEKTLTPLWQNNAMHSICGDKRHASIIMSKGYVCFILQKVRLLIYFFESLYNTLIFAQEMKTNSLKPLFLISLLGVTA